MPSENQQATEPVLSARELADRWGASARSVLRWAQQGRRPRPFRLPNGRWRWRLRDVEEYEREQEAAP